MGDALVPLPGKVAVRENAPTQGEHQLAELRELKCWGIEVLCIQARSPRK